MAKIPVNVIVEKQVTKADFCKFLGINRHFDEHDESMVSESRTRLSRTIVGERRASLKLDSLAPPVPDESWVKGALSSSLIKPELLMPTAVILSFSVRQTTQNSV